MPRLDLERDTPGPRVRGFTGDGRFRVDDRIHRAVLLTPLAASDWSPPPLDALAIDDVAAVLTPSPEFLLLGTGPIQGHPPLAFRQAIEALGLAVEAMDSRAAARLWGVLRAEGRQIAAAFYPLG